MWLKNTPPSHASTNVTLMTRVNVVDNAAFIVSTSHYRATKSSEEKHHPRRNVPPTNPNPHNQLLWKSPSSPSYTIARRPVSVLSRCVL